MNKKIIALVVAIIVIIAGLGLWLISSNNKKESLNNSNSSNMNGFENSNQGGDKENTNDEKIAIIYFSATGNTKKVAGYIKDVTNGDLIEIVPKEKYTDSEVII